MKLLGRMHVRIPCDFPQMAVRILKRAGVAAPRRFMRRIANYSSCAPGLINERIDFRFAANIVSEREFGCAARSQRNLGLMGEIPQGPDRQFLAVRQVKEGDGSVFILSPDDSSSWETQPGRTVVNGQDRQRRL